MRFSTEKSRNWLTRDNDTPSVTPGLLLALGALQSAEREARASVSVSLSYIKNYDACRSDTAFQDVLLLLLLAVVLVEINQEENVHLPLGSVLSVQRPEVGRVAPGWEVYVESVVWPCGSE